MFCTNCGTTLAPDIRFCTACGAPAPGAPMPPPMQAPAQPPMQAPMQPPMQPQPGMAPPMAYAPPARRTNPAMIVIVILAVLIIVGVGVGLALMGGVSLGGTGTCTVTWSDYPPTYLYDVTEAECDARCQELQTEQSCYWEP